MPTIPAQPWRRSAGVLAVCLAGAMVVGCGSSGYGPTGLETGPAPPTGNPASTPERVVASPGRPVRAVTMRGLAFQPKTVSIVVGQSVDWINRDDVRHNVTTLDGTTIASPDLPPGGRFVYVPARPGRLRYYCTIHPSTMSAELIVRPG